MINKISLSFLLFCQSLAFGGPHSSRVVTINPSGDCARWEEKYRLWITLPDLVVGKYAYGYYADHQFDDEQSCWRTKLALADHYGRKLDVTLDETSSLVTDTHSEDYVCGGVGMRPRYCHRTVTTSSRQVEAVFSIDGVDFHALTRTPVP